MPITLQSLAECRLVGEIHGQQYVNVWHMGSELVEPNSDAWEAALLQLAQAMLECAVTHLLPGVTSDFRLVRAEAKLLHPLVTDYFVATAVPSNVGELGPTSVSFASSLVNIRTGRDGRKGRGRKFLPPPGEANITDSLLDEPTLVQIAAFLTCLAGKFIGANPTEPWRIGVLSRKDLGGIFTNAAQAWREAKSLNPVAQVSVMRSRKVGRGS